MSADGCEKANKLYKTYSPLVAGHEDELRSSSSSANRSDGGLDSADPVAQ